MVQVKCDCNERCGIVINTDKLFEEIKGFFEEQVKTGIFSDIPVAEPFYVGYSEVKNENIEWYATKWYKCNICGCLWEFNYPDFPANGFVKKFDNGKYIPDNG